MLYIRWFTDIHNPPGEYMQDGLLVDQKAYKAQILNALDFVVADSQKAAPHWIIDGGDHIDTTADAEIDRALHHETQNRLRALYERLIEIAGNHDVRHPVLDAHTQFNFQAGGKIIAHDDATIIVWGASVEPQGLVGDGPGSHNRKYYEASPIQVAWLKDALAAAAPAKPVLLFTHIPLDTNAFSEPLDINEQNNPFRSHYRNGQDIRDMINASGRKVFVFSGHRHVNRNSVCCDIPMFTMDRLLRTEEKSDDRRKGMNYADIRVGNGQLVYERFGAKPARFELVL
ncbi:MAG TPA: hypothetical protein VIN59_00840 [Alphaproteobacteria bacterium]